MPHRAPNSRLARWLKGSLAAGFSLCLSTPLLATDEPALADPPAPPATVAPAASPAVTIVPAYTLADCLHIGREHQPSIQAAVASLGSAQMAQKGLNEIRFGSRLSKELPVRKQQSSFGVAAASANLCQVQRDVDCSIARMYFSVLYAREQKKVAESISARLRATVAVGETLLGKEGALADLNTLSIERAKLYAQLASARVDEANRGLQRAGAALREAMGVGPECPFVVIEDKLPPVISGVNKDQIVQMAESMRGEVSMASSAAYIARLEIKAQEAARRPAPHRGFRRRYALATRPHRFVWR